MDPLTSAAASGMRARLESLDMLANNIANASVPGFKADREYYNLYRSVEAADSPDTFSTHVLPVIERQWTDFAQGSLMPTGNTLDVSLSGRGFLVAQSPSGAVYTRGGSLRISTQGSLETQDGYSLQGQDGKPVQLDTSKPIDISPDGIIHQDGQDISRLAVVDIADAQTLSKKGSNYFWLDSSAIQPVPAVRADVLQGKLEAANAQPAESAVRLVNILRQFETLQKAMAIGAEMNRRAVEEVAKVTS